MAPEVGGLELSTNDEIRDQLLKANHVPPTCEYLDVALGTQIKKWGDEWQFSSSDNGQIAMPRRMKGGRVWMCLASIQPPICSGTGCGGDTGANAVFC
jgi:hypothetical protein